MLSTRTTLPVGTTPVRHTVLRTTLLAFGISAAASLANAQVLVNADIAVSTTWTANNTYNLQKQIYVLPGATLTIQAGTVVASTTNLGGSLAVCRGAQIIVQGTEKNPVIMTSTADVATWTGGNPKTGTWRTGVNEWGNLTIMGRGYISENVVPVGLPPNNPAPTATNWAAMEGLIAQFPGDPNVLYGGGDDWDDSGTITYLSIRYGGKVIALNNELNGLSLGGIGRETDIHHVEIMNNVDDGIEVWGGAVNLKYFSIWNIGDDSLDLDQGWRGKAQFGLIVQGYSVDAAQGSGVGDNCFETDGAEDSDWQPVTTATIYNCTVIGQPFDGDHATAWRDNARIQYRNMIITDCGEEVVRNDHKDGDGANGYGWNGTLSFVNTWTTPYTSTSLINAPANPAAFYQSQTSGNLIEITDSVFFNNTHAAAYTEANNRLVFAAANNNVKEPASSPITGITRAAAVLLPTANKVMARVTALDPRPANDALTSVAWAPRDGFFCSAHYRGAFAPGNDWMAGWTASSAFGMTSPGPWTDLGKSLAGTYGAPVLSGAGTLAGGSPVTLTLSNAKENAPGALVVGASRIDFPFAGGTLVPFPSIVVNIATNGSGSAVLNLTWPMGVPSGLTSYLQMWVADAAGPSFLSATNAVAATAP